VLSGDGAGLTLCKVSTPSECGGRHTSARKEESETMSVVASTVTTAITGLQAQLILVLVAAISLAAIVFGIKYGWQVFRGTVRKS